MAVGSPVLLRRRVPTNHVSLPTPCPAAAECRTMECQGRSHWSLDHPWYDRQHHLLRREAAESISGLRWSVPIVCSLERGRVRSSVRLSVAYPSSRRTQPRRDVVALSCYHPRHESHRSAICPRRGTARACASLDARRRVGRALRGQHPHRRARLTGAPSSRCAHLGAAWSWWGATD